MKEGMVQIGKESESNEMTGSSEGDHYPYGTSLEFSDDLLEQLGISDMKVGDVVEIHSVAVVKGTSEHKEDGSESKSMSFQLTAVKVCKDKGDMVQRLYGDEDKS